MKKKFEIADVVFHIICILSALACLIPVILVISISLTSEAGIVENGYTLWPSEFSLDAYKYIWESRDTIFRAYGVTIFNAVLGTLLSVSCIALYAYALSRPNLIGKKFFTYILHHVILRRSCSLVYGMYQNASYSEHSLGTNCTPFVQCMALYHIKNILQVNSA